MRVSVFMLQYCSIFVVALVETFLSIALCVFGNSTQTFSMYKTIGMFIYIYSSIYIVGKDSIVKLKEVVIGWLLLSGT